MSQFKIIRCRFQSEIEEQLNKLAEDYTKVDAQCITYDHNINQYTLVVKLGDEVLPMTYYSPIDNQYYIV